MSLHSLHPTHEQFQSIDWQSVLAESKSHDCIAYQSSFQHAARRAAEADNAEEAELYAFMYNVCLLILQPDNPDRMPFVPMFGGGGLNSTGIDDFDTKHLDLLVQLLSEISEPELKARVADIIWTRKHGDNRHEMASVAIESYLLSATYFEQNEKWHDCKTRIKRALQIALELGAKSDFLEQVVNNIEIMIAKYEHHPSPILLVELLRLLSEYRLGDAAKYALVAEGRAKEMLNVTEKVQIEWDWLRWLWELAAAFHSRANDSERSFQAQIAKADTYKAQAQWISGDQSQHLPTAKFLVVQGIEAFRRIPNTESKRQDLHRYLLELQEKGLNDFAEFSEEIDVQPLVSCATKAVKRKSFQEALFTLALMPKSPCVETLRQEAKERSQQSPLFSVIGATIIDSEGKTKANRPGLTEDNEEVVLQCEMFRQARTTQRLTAGAIIQPALIQINNEHYYSEKDFGVLVRDNPFIPAGREYIFARGLCLGLRGNWLESTHLLMPQIENSLRYILKNHGCIVSNLTDQQVQDEYSLNKMLQETHTNELEEILGKDIVFDLQGLLIERFGTNLRNEMAHGLLDTMVFGSPEVLYLWWLTLRLCVLPLCRQPSNQPPQQEE